MKLLVALALAAVPSALAMAPYVPPTPQPPYIINGEECPESNIMIESGAGACFDDGKDAEGSVCANDGTIDEAYCSYVPEGYRCARCE